MVWSNFCIFGISYPLQSTTFYQALTEISVAPCSFDSIDVCMVTHTDTCASLKAIWTGEKLAEMCRGGINVSLIITAAAHYEATDFHQ